MEQGLTAYNSATDPLLTTTHKRRRLAFAYEHVNWATDDWKKYCLWMSVEYQCMVQMVEIRSTEALKNVKLHALGHTWLFLVMAQ